MRARRFLLGTLIAVAFIAVAGVTWAGDRTVAHYGPPRNGPNMGGTRTHRPVPGTGLHITPTGRCTARIPTGAPIRTLGADRSTVSTVPRTIRRFTVASSVLQ
jgi:hypothetical protein